MKIIAQLVFWLWVAFVTYRVGVRRGREEARRAFVLGRTVE